MAEGWRYDRILPLLCVKVRVLEIHQPQTPAYEFLPRFEDIELIWPECKPDRKEGKY